MTITSVQLDGNRIASIGASSIARAIPQLNALEEVRTAQHALSLRCWLRLRHCRWCLGRFLTRMIPTPTDYAE